MHRRRIALYGTLAVCLIATLVGVSLNQSSRLSANAFAAEQSRINSSIDPAHPAVFTFAATRKGGSLVALHGRYVVWNGIDEKYRPASDQVAVEVQDGSTWNSIGFFSTDASGRYAGHLRIPGGRTLRARAVEGTDRTIAQSASVTLPFAAKTRVVWSAVQAMRSNGDVEVMGSVNGAWALDPKSHSVLYRGAYPGRVAIQQRVDGVWTTVKRVAVLDNGAFDGTVASSATTFRVKVAGTAEYAKSSTTVTVPTS